MSCLYDKPYYAESDVNDINDLVESQLELHLMTIDMILQGFLGHRIRICIPFASKSHPLNNNQLRLNYGKYNCLRVNEGGEFKNELYWIQMLSDERRSTEIVLIEKISHDNFGFRHSRMTFVSHTLFVVHITFG